MLVSVIVVSLLLLVLFSSLCINWGLAWIEMERFVFGIAQPALLGIFVEQYGGVLWLAAVETGGTDIVWEAATRFLAPLCMCCSQYFWSGTTSLLHRHFFPSVLLHLPGSSSFPFRSSKHEPLQPWTEKSRWKEGKSHFTIPKESNVLKYNHSKFSTRHNEIKHTPT